MGKHKSKQGRNPGRDRTGAAGAAFVRVDSPFSQLPEADFSAALIAAGAAAARDLETRLKTLEGLLRTVNILDLLSVLAFHGLFVAVTQSGRTKERDEQTAISQHHVELAQALALRVPASELVASPIVPDKVQEVWELLVSLANAFDSKRYGQAADAVSQQDKARLFLQERLRLHTHRVRNWGYYREVIQISQELYAPLDDYFRTEIGLDATSLIRVFQWLVDETNARGNRHWNRLRPAMQAHTLEEAATEYYKAFPDMQDTPEKFAAFLKENQVPLNSAKALILSHADLSLRDLFVFSTHALSEKEGIDVKSLSSALQALSMRFGDLGECPPEHLFLDNPVWTKPVILLDEDRFFCALPQVFFSFSLRILDGILAGRPCAHKACARRRSDFLESKLVELACRAFPGCDLIRNLKWLDGDVGYETDLLVRVDSYLLIVEAKSGAISWSALRGAPERAKRHIQDLLIDPAEQSQRLALKLRLLMRGEPANISFVDPLPFDITNVHQVIRLSVTLEDFATIQANVEDLRLTGWLPEGIESSPTMCLSDIRTVFDILHGVPERLHYLVRRFELEQHVRYVGDEMDLLGLYLATAFNLAQIEFDQNAMFLTGMSRSVDEYYIARDLGITRRRPVVKSTQWWADIRSQIEQRQVQRWSEAAIMLLNVSFKDQKRLEKAFKEVAKSVRKNWRHPNHANSIICQPPKWRTDAFVLLAFRERESRERHQKMEGLARQVFAEGHATRCLIIAVNIDRGIYPYRTLGVFHRPDGGAEGPSTHVTQP